MGDVVGYALIDRDAKTGVGPDIKSFLGEQVRVMEFAQDGGVLVLNREASAMAMFDKCDVVRSFKCGEIAGVITPPDLSLVDQMIYIANASARKGGYNHIVKYMVVAASLHRNEFCDSLLWAVEKEEQRMAQERDQAKSKAPTKSSPTNQP
jgi:hypothetical protein